MILTQKEMIETEEEAFARGASAAVLMESAGRQMADVVGQFHPRPGRVLVFAGKGHNGGDVLVAARHLSDRGWAIQVQPVFPEDDLAPLTRKHLHHLPSSLDHHLSHAGPVVILDGLLGIGATGQPRDPVAAAIRRINDLRNAHAAWVLSADVPSGLDATTGEPSDPCVVADATVTIGFVKSGLVADRATNFVGRLAVAELPDLIPPAGSGCADSVSTPAAIGPRIQPRNFDTHKGTCGRVAILAGAIGWTGAARLCAAGAIRGGAGLVTLFASEEIYPILAASALPEIMVRPAKSLLAVLDSNWDALAIGPGLGRAHDDTICEIIRSATCPCVVDADALNAIAGSDALAETSAPRLLTPHPGEMERLFSRHDRSRRQWARDFVETYPVSLLLKGARTLIAERDHPIVYNPTGHPGMATGGMGDVLTGVCSALIAQGKSTRDAAIIGSWVCGHAAELALVSGSSQESLTASDTLHHLGHAFSSARSGRIF